MNNQPQIVHQSQLNTNLTTITSDKKFRFWHRHNFPNYLEEKQVLEIKRYLKHDTFAVKAEFLANQEFTWASHVQTNNKDNFELGINQLLPNQWQQAIFAPTKLKNLKFNTLQSLSLISNQRENYTEKLRFLSQVAIAHNDHLKEYIVTKGGIHFRSPKIIRNLATASNGEIDFINQVFYNNIILFPQAFEHDKHNYIVYKVAIFNDDQEVIDRDLALLPKKISGLPIKGNGSLDLIFQPASSKEFINNLQIIGNIEISNNTYYDFAKKQTVEGLAIASQRGYILPFNFQGELAHIMSIDLNPDFTNSKIIYTQNLAKAFLDPYEGIVKLKLVNKIPNTTQQLMTFYIKNKDFGKIATSVLSLNAIKNLAHYKDEDELLVLKK